MNIEDQVVFITGGGRGLGKSIASAFARAGSYVVINYLHSQKSAHALANQIGSRAIAIQGDVTDRDHMAKAMSLAKDRFGRNITTIVNNALSDFKFNGDLRSSVGDITWLEFDAQLTVALKGALNTLQAAKPDMERARFGRIINIGTNLVQNPVVPYHDYTAAKAALLGFTRTAATELGPLGINVNMVSGGLLRTTDASAATPEVIFDSIAAATPLRRVITPEEFSDVVIFFASKNSRSVTGQNLVVDGGLVLN